MSDATLFEGTAGRFPLLDLLDRPDDLAGALEEWLLSPQLLELVRQLSGLAEPSGLRLDARPEPSGLRLDARPDTSGLRLDARLPELKAKIVQSGLAILTEDELRLVMSQPHWLLELQTAVLLEGGPFWDEVALRVRTSGVRVRPAEPPALEGWPAWYRSPWAWAANALTFLAAAIAVIVIGARNAPQTGDVEARLSQQSARAETLARELDDLRRLHPPALPADLPEDPIATAAPPDPPDLPETDPNDLPEAPKKQPGVVEL